MGKRRYGYIRAKSSGPESRLELKRENDIAIEQETVSNCNGLVRSFSVKSSVFLLHKTDFFACNARSNTSNPTDAVPNQCTCRRIDLTLLFYKATRTPFDRSNTRSLYCGYETLNAHVAKREILSELTYCVLNESGSSTTKVPYT